MGCLDDPVTELPPDPATAKPRTGNYDLIVVLFCGLLLISNIGATKLIQFGPIITDGGAILFPLTYILGDVLSEVYGFGKARRAILLGFGLSILASLTFWLVQGVSGSVSKQPETTTSRSMKSSTCDRQ